MKMIADLTSTLTARTRGRLAEAFASRRAHFADKIFFYAPSLFPYETTEFSNHGESLSFVPLSITGTACALDCKHCGKSILRSMRAIGSPEELLRSATKLAKRGTRGLLISGGSDCQGRVPFDRYWDAMARVKGETGMKLAIHCGLVTRDETRRMARAGVDVAMLDVLADPSTIREVYNLGLSPEAYEESLSALSEEGIRVAPHVVIGLHFGRIAGEYRALEMIRKHEPMSVVLVVLKPLEGTAMAEVTPPSPEEVLEVVLEARLTMPVTPVLLGCARPLGKHQERSDRLAVAAGVNGMAFPSEGLVEFSKTLGLAPHFSYDCCSFIYDDLDQEV